MSFETIPEDPVILYSFLNTKLRDFYTSFEELCDDLNLEKEPILKKLKMMDFHYDEKLNQFV